MGGRRETQWARWGDATGDGRDVVKETRTRQKKTRGNETTRHETERGKTKENEGKRGKTRENEPNEQVASDDEIRVLVVVDEMGVLLAVDEIGILVAIDEMRVVATDEMRVVGRVIVDEEVGSRGRHWARDARRWTWHRQ
jgi:hypothetical protein